MHVHPLQPIRWTKGELYMFHPTPVFRSLCILMELREEGRFGKGRGGRNMKGSFCMPRFRSNRVSLLERFRAVIFKLIMLSAISKGAQNIQPNGSGRPRSYPTESHYSEAVADCIEFIKKSALEESGGDSMASSGSVEASCRPSQLCGCGY